MSSTLEAVDASPGQLAVLDQAAERLVGLLAAQARLCAEVTMQLALCGEVAREIGALDPHPKNQDFVDAMVASELGARTRINDRAMENMMGEAHCLVNEYPRTVAALHDAEISQAHVRVIQSAGVSIKDSGLRAGYETAVLEHAVKETTNRLRPIAKRLAEQFADATLEERHEREKVRRFVDVTSLGDGMAQLIALLPATEAFAIKDRLSQLAHATPDPSRSIAELRADILTDLLLCASPTPEIHGASPTPAIHGASPTPEIHGASPTPEIHGASPTPSIHGETHGNIGLPLGGLQNGGLPIGDLQSGGLQSGGDGLRNVQARVLVTIPVLALFPAARGQENADLSSGFESFSGIAGLDGSPQLAGHSPIDVETARILAGNAKSWTRVMVHPITGAVLAVDRYRPSEEQRRTLGARDLHCRFPGCRIPIQKCDLDHTIAAEHGGPTEISNLAHLCRRHHSLKHHGKWSVEQLENGTLRWTSPTGYIRTEDPPSTAMFKPTVPSKPSGQFNNPFGELPPF